MRHYQKVDGGDSVLIDLGGYGILAKLDDKKKWYDVCYVTVKYDNAGAAIPSLLPADMLIDDGTKETFVKQAKAIRIWRHGRP